MVMYLATVADTQYRDTNLENGRVNVGCALVVDGRRSSRQNDTLRVKGKIRKLRSTWQHLSIDFKASQPAENQVARLAAKVQNEDGL
jgi:hypothetical protein